MNRFGQKLKMESYCLFHAGMDCLNVNLAFQWRLEGYFETTLSFLFGHDATQDLIIDVKCALAKYAANLEEHKALQIGQKSEKVKVVPTKARKKALWKH